MIGQYKTPIKPEVRVAGLDMAARKSGVALLHRGHFQTDLVLEPKLRGAARLDSITTKIENIVVLDHFRPDLVVIEDISYGSCGRITTLAEVAGVVKLLLFRHGIKFVLVSPRTLKLFTTGNGGASKKKMIASVEKYYGVVTDSDDIADAVACASLAYVLITGESNRRCELEVALRLRGNMKAQFNA